jgi:hypothetical protein
VGAAVKKSTAQGEAYDFKYNISDLPEVGLKTGFGNSMTFRIPFTVKSRQRDKPVAEGIATLKLTRRADTPSVTVNKSASNNCVRIPLPTVPAWRKQIANSMRSISIC